MPCIIKGRIISVAINPIFNKIETLTDLAIEVSIADIYRQKLQKSSRQPNTLWDQSFRVEVSDESKLQNYPLKFELLEADGGGLGALYIDLSILLYNFDTKIEGWLPTYDSLNGLSGKIYCMVGVDFVKEMNPYSEGAGSTPVFCASIPPTSEIKISSIHGFVEELLVVNDSEYDWKDLIRSSRISNETRRTILQEASMQTRRSIAKKALHAGANAVLGYSECVDFEGDVTHRICSRGVGTAVTLSSNDCKNMLQCGATSMTEHTEDIGNAASTYTEDKMSDSVIDVDPLRKFDGHMKWKFGQPQAHSGTDVVDDPTMIVDDREINSFFKNVEILTMDRFPPSIEYQLGGIVSARSVKLLQNRLTQDQRHSYWVELRDELRSHAMALNCDSIIGYKERLCINGEVLLLSCSGTAVVISGLATQHTAGISAPSTILNEDRTLTPLLKHSSATAMLTTNRLAASPGKTNVQHCSAVHVSELFDRGTASTALCRLCEKERVPSIVLSTAECPVGLLVRGSATGAEARVCRYLKRNYAEMYATEVSEVLPFMELDLHRQLLLKLRLHCCNAAFGVRVEYSLGENLIIGTAAATGVFVEALPPPDQLAIDIPHFYGGGQNNKELEEKRKVIEERNLRNSSHIMSQPQSTAALLEMSPVASGYTSDIPIPTLNLAFNLDYNTKGERDANMKMFSRQSVDEGPTSPLHGTSHNAVVENYGGHRLSAPSSSEAFSKAMENRPVFCFDVTDDTDESLFDLLYEDAKLPYTFLRSTVDCPPGLELSCCGEVLSGGGRLMDVEKGCNLFYAIRAIEFPESILRSPISIAKYITELQEEIYASVFFSCAMHGVAHGCISAVDCRLLIMKDNVAKMLLTGQFLPMFDKPSTVDKKLMNGDGSTDRMSGVYNKKPNTMKEEGVKEMEVLADILQSTSCKEFAISLFTPLKCTTNGSNGCDGVMNRLAAPIGSDKNKDADTSLKDMLSAKNLWCLETKPVTTVITPLNALPNSVVKRHLGMASFHVIREATNKTSDDFYREFMSHVLSILRSHVVALGGNAMLGYKVSNIYVEEDKNKTYAILSISGDVAEISEAPPSSAK